MLPHLQGWGEPVDQDTGRRSGKGRIPCRHLGCASRIRAHQDDGLLWGRRHGGVHERPCGNHPSVRNGRGRHPERELCEVGRATNEVLSLGALHMLVVGPLDYCGMADLDPIVVVVSVKVTQPEPNSPEIEMEAWNICPSSGSLGRHPTSGSGLSSLKLKYSTLFRRFLGCLQSGSRLRISCWDSRKQLALLQFLNLEALRSWGLLAGLGVALKVPVL